MFLNSAASLQWAVIVSYVSVWEIDPERCPLLEGVPFLGRVALRLLFLKVCFIFNSFFSRYHFAVANTDLQEQEVMN